MKAVPGVVSIGLDGSSRVSVGGIGDDVTAGAGVALREVITDQILPIHQLMTFVVGPHRSMVVTGGWQRGPRSRAGPSAS